MEGEEEGLEEVPVLEVASLSRNSTKSWEKDCVKAGQPAKTSVRLCNTTTMDDRDGRLTSFAGSSSALLGVFGGTILLERRAAAEAPVDDRWRPACSRSTSDHDRIDESTVSISNRFGSARGVMRNERRMLVTSRLLDTGQIYLISDPSRLAMRLGRNAPIDIGVG